MLWIDGRLCVLDTGEGSALRARLLMDGLDLVHTVQVGTLCCVWHCIRAGLP